MEFEFDPKKSESNKEKHGIDFIEAQKLWSGETVTLRSKNQDEPRQIVIGKINCRFWTGIATFRVRNGQEKIRIISVRRSRDEEKKIYNEK